MADQGLEKEYTVSQAAEVLNVARPTIYNWVRLGYLKAYVRGPRRIFIPQSSIDTHLKGREYATRENN